MIYRIPIYIIILVSVLLGTQKLILSDAETVNYRCPPCGCSGDVNTFSDAGICPSCEMDLYRVTSHRTFFVQTANYWMADNNGKLYDKFLYPAFIIGILIGMFSLVKLNGKAFNPFLGGFVLVLAMYAFKNQIYGVEYGLTPNYRFLFVPISFISALGPLVYFYFRSQTEAFRWKSSYYLHFLPAGIFFLFYLIPLLSNDQIKDQFLRSQFEPIFGHLEQVVALSSVLIYLYISSRRLSTMALENRDSSKSRWLQRFYLSIILLSFTWALLSTTNLTYFDLGVATLTYKPLWIAISLLIYWILIEAFLNSKQFFSQTFSSLGHTREKIEEDKVRIEEVLEVKKLYLDPSLSLDQLAEEAGMNPKYASSVINSGFHKNFYELVNAYRVEEVKKLLLKPEYKHLTIVAIANEAGFNSKSSFNSIFKKHTQMTPREYLRACAANN